MVAASVIEELTGRAELKLGTTVIRPSIREIRGPTSVASMEPRIMQVLVTLADANGEVVNRAELMRRCWGGQIVGDDALNRVISEIRHLAKTIANDSFKIETISKVGYRLVSGSTPQPVLNVPPPFAAEPISAATSRRALIITGLGLVASAAAIYASFGDDGNDDSEVGPQTAAFLTRGDAAMRADMPDSNRQGIQYYQQAAVLSPGSAAVHARLALAWRAASEFAPPDQRAAAVAACEAAALNALAIDPRSPDAKAALALLQPEFGDWFGAEQRLRAVLAIDPRNEAASGGLAVLLHGVGRVREAAILCDSLYAHAPLSPRYTYWRTYSRWALGDLGTADQTVDRGMELWPRHPGVWFARLWLYALTGRPVAAQRMLDDRGAAPSDLSGNHVNVIRPSLMALVSGSAADHKAAIAANLAAVITGPSWAVFATMILSKLGELDAAFEVAEGYLLRHGPLVGTLRHTSAQPSVNDQRHRKTMMLFIPPTATMRSDPRFAELCEAIGMAAYWREARVRPDPDLDRMHVHSD